MNCRKQIKIKRTKKDETALEELGIEDIQVCNFDRERGEEINNPKTGCHLILEKVAFGPRHFVPVKKHRQQVNAE